MYYSAIKKMDIADGPGVRVTLFVSGCTNHCEGCFQPETWDFDYGVEYTPEIEEQIMTELAKSHYHGLTILGGEPFEPSNQEVIVTLIRRVREELPDKTIWIYTGFLYDRDLCPGGRRYTEHTDEILDSIDTLVDGRFELAKKNIMLRFRGSENQRIIDMKETRAAGEVVLDPLGT
ncbi:MAG: anaerobic ribonucleoside-triphosphate reductase activating protein [Lachnospiraceae bacterium]|nr:anaerobic ribonucleoside-triphosphate reductase activating protein [Lachnospiraceae bacterium]